MSAELRMTYMKVDLGILQCATNRNYICAGC